MTGIEYPRPQPDRGIKPPLSSLGVLTVVIATIGVLSGLEVMLVGEELSTLGKNLLQISLDEGSLHHLEADYGLHSTHIGMAVLVFSTVRLVMGVGLIKGSHWPTALGALCTMHAVLTDLLCFSIPLVLGAVGLDLYLLYRLIERRGA